MIEGEIARLRDEIASVDKEIVALVAKRLHLAGQVGIEKRRMGLPLRDLEAEERVYARLLAEGAPRDISETFVEGLFHLLVDESVRRQESLQPSDPVDKKVLVVGGAGQMGRWLCRYLRSRGYGVVVNDIAGPFDGFPFERDLAKAVREADIVAVSVPMSASEEVLQRIAALRPRGLVFDICSLKAPVEKQLRAMGKAGLRVTSVHPMFGPTLFPLSSGNITFSDCGNGLAVLEAKDLFRPSGASFVDMSLDHHDEFMSFLLGLSHLSLLAFARTVANSPFDFGGLRRPAGTTFSRLAIASMGLLQDPPALLREIQALNPHTPEVHRKIRAALDDWERAATSPDPAEFYRLMDHARSYFGGVSA